MFVVRLLTITDHFVVWLVRLVTKFLVVQTLFFNEADNDEIMKLLETLRSCLET